MILGLGLYPILVAPLFNNLIFFFGDQMNLFFFFFNFFLLKLTYFHILDSFFINLLLIFKIFDQIGKTKIFNFFLILRLCLVPGKYDRKCEQNKIKKEKKKKKKKG